MLDMSPMHGMIRVNGMTCRMKMNKMTVPIEKNAVFAFLEFRHDGFGQDGVVLMLIHYRIFLP